MSLIATWFSEGRRAQHPPDPRYPLGMLFDASAGRPFAPQTSHRARGQGGRGGSKSESRVDAAVEHLAARRTTTSCARRTVPAFRHQRDGPAGGAVGAV